MFPLPLNTDFIKQKSRNGYSKESNWDSPKLELALITSSTHNSLWSRISKLSLKVLYNAFIKSLSELGDISVC